MRKPEYQQAIRSAQAFAKDAAFNAIYGAMRDQLLETKRRWPVDTGLSRDSFAITVNPPRGKQKTRLVAIESDVRYVPYIRLRGGVVPFQSFLIKPLMRRLNALPSRRR